MAVIENDVVMKFKDSSGNVNLLYPITRADNVDGLQEAIRNQSVVTKGTGAVYTATVAGITSLSAGVSFVMIPHTVSTTSSPNLNVNGLGEKLIQRRVSNCTGTFYNGSAPSNWLTARKPITVTYDGEYWIADLPVPNANDIMGAVPITNGGTGATTATQARINLGIETTDGTVSSGNENYAEVGEWVDGNPDAEDRIGYFVCVDNTTSKMTMRKATEIDDVRGVTITAPAFSGNCSNDKFDSDGNLIAKYSFVAVMGIASVIDNGTCSIGGRCMPTNDGTAIPSPNSMGYQVISRIDATHVLIMVEPQADMLVRIKNDVTQKADLPKTVSGTAVTMGDASDGPLQGLRIYGRTTQDGTPTPEAPVELVSVGESMSVTMVGKNLFNSSDLNPRGGVSVTISEDGRTITVIGRGQYAGAHTKIPIEAVRGKTVILAADSAMQTSNIAPGYFIQITIATESGVTHYKTISPSSLYNSFDMPEDIRSVSLGVYVNNSNTSLDSDNTVVVTGLRVYLSSNAAWEPYITPQTLPISTPNGLPGVPVASGGNYTDADGQQWICDEVDLARGIYVKRVTKVMFDGSGNIALNSNTQYPSTNVRFDLVRNDVLNIAKLKVTPQPILSNYSVAARNFNSTGVWLNNEHDYFEGRISIPSSIASTVEEFSQLLANTPIVFIAPLAIPIETPIPADELAAYAALHTNKPNTTIYNDAGAHMDVGYYPPDATMRQADIAKALDTAKTEANTYTDSKRLTATATITTTWSGSGPYTQAVSVSGILSTDTPHIMPAYSTTNSTAISQKEAWACVSKAETSANTITFTCFEEKPTTAIPIQIEVMR